MNETSCDLVQARKQFSRIGLAFCAVLVITLLMQVLCIAVPALIWGEDNWLATSSWGKWLVSFVPLYLVAVPVGLLILRKLPAEKPQDNKLGTKNFLIFFIISMFVTYGGNIIGTVLSMVFSGGNAENALIDYAMDTNPLKILFMVILAPLLEEYLCRKQIIDRTRQYGEKTAVFLCAIIFGLLHQNLFQFFYAFGMGLVFGYIYIRTGRLRYSVLLHSIINFLGAVVAPWMLSLVNIEALFNMDPKAVLGMMVCAVYVLFQLGMAIAGLVLLIIQSRKLIWKEGNTQLPSGTCAKTVYWNLGMVLYILVCTVFIVLSLI